MKCNRTDRVRSVEGRRKPAPSTETICQVPPQGRGTMIVPGRREHAGQMAELHHRYIKSLLRDLGKRMCLAFYEDALQREDIFASVCVEGRKVVGFALGTRDNSQLFNTRKLRLELAFALCRRPGLFKRLVLRLLSQSAPSPELAYVAVDPEHRRRGIGKRLLQALHGQFTRRGIGHYEVRVDHDNLASLALHQGLGAKVEEGFWEDGIYRLRLTNVLSCVAVASLMPFWSCF